MAVDALNKSIKTTQPSVKLIHHTDRGGQYAGKVYPQVLRRAGMLPSMSRAGDCYDNAFLEPCLGTIKNQLEMTKYKGMRKARRELTEYNNYYNTRPRHSSPGYLTPAQFEAAA